ncbi:MAG: STAS domain-containing protein [bacterium]
MELNVVEDGDISILDVDGEVDVYYSSAIEEKIKDLIKQGRKKVIVDLSKVTYMDSSGLGVLVGSLKNLRKVGGSLKIAEINPAIANIFEITKLDSFFDIYKTLDEAKGTFE